ncbi:hypothetical protein CEV33_3194 [Brucella grignonensis]|uniref:Uncharacterized protein n=1 Tax=Brucella grignonensis TaxID=94627 RepID=A0A256F0Q0_9HYPH|nr:hypothetical protein CEV33_3194 [Brucella grignonensis]
MVAEEIVSGRDCDVADLYRHVGILWDPVSDHIAWSVLSSPALKTDIGDKVHITDIAVDYAT